MIGKDHRLKGYYLAVKFIGPASVMIVGAFIFFFKDYFLFLGPTDIVLWLFVAVWIAHTISFTLHEIYKKKIFFTMFRFSWVAFFGGLVLATGGVGSHLVYLFTFPTLVAAVDLEAKDVKRTSMVIFAFLFSLFLFDTNATMEESFLHGFSIFTLYIISYFAHKLVTEKEAIHRDFDRLRAVELIKTDFITIASNRLRTPLTGALYAFNELSNDAHISESQKKIVDGGLAHAEMANAVVNELVHAVELDAYHIQIFPEIVDIPSLVRQVVGEMEKTMKDKGVSVFVTAPSALTVQANPGMIKLALGNVIDNAVRYNPKGKVEVTVTEEKGMCEVVVKDSGIGIIESDLPLLFERLYRGDNATHLEPNRSGVGLYAAKRVLELHKGTIGIVSKEGQGTTVKIAFPMV